MTYQLVEEKLIELLMNCLLESLPNKVDTDHSYQKFSKILDYIHGNLSEITNVYQVCENTDIPERTIRRLINNKYNLSPKGYLNKLRLNAVRRSLKSNDSKTNIVQSASEYNFWHMGQFSKDYKNLFGELPSVTLKR